MNKALMEWLEGGDGRSLQMQYRGNVFRAALCVGKAVYIRTDAGSNTREAAEESLANKLASEAGRVLSAKDD